MFTVYKLLQIFIHSADDHKRSKGPLLPISSNFFLYVCKEQYIVELCS